MKMNSTAWWVIGVLVVAGGLIFLSNMLRTASTPSTEEASEVLTLVADDHKKGAEDGKVVLVEYLDFECEACGAYYPVVKQMEEEFGNRVTFVARYFPLQGHRNGMTAALAAEAAGRQGKFWEMHDLMYTRQKDWGEKQVSTPEVFEEYAQELGLNMEQFKTDVASASVKERVERNLNQAIELKLQGTPSFFLQGKKIANPQSPEAFKALIRAELERAGS
ncbi:MAG: Periplasmic thiol:disulfide interchange protein DsbA [Parcubacteria bacterium C7867-001]|nr:MAG: Periplasmic thiol:disulfide interchange protein DsbA [Parcubacteria bacterium C7867-001]